MAANPQVSTDPNGKDPAAIDYLALVRDLTPELAAAAQRIDEERELPQAVIDKMIAQGFFRLLLPRSLGGAELLPAHYVPIIEAFARVNASLAWCLNQNSGCSMTAAYLAPEVAQDIFGGPRGILAWGPGPGEARAVAERPWRDVHSVSQQIQGRQAHYETVGAYLMGLEADTTWL